MKLSTLILALVCFAQLGGSSANEATDIMRRQLRVGKAVASLFENQHQSTRELEEKIMQDEDNKPNEVQADMNVRWQAKIAASAQDETNKDLGDGSEQQQQSRHHFAHSSIGSELPLAVYQTRLSTHNEGQFGGCACWDGDVPSGNSIGRTTSTGYTADKLNLRILEGDMMGQQQRVQSDARILAEDGIEETAGGGWNELLGEKRRTTTKAAGMMAQADDTDDESLLASGRRTRKLASEIRRRT
ncbi:hypothetical protein GQ600_15533 [Phytophthora cactorum]|nr:hypothetical protein GQ600_15533 [Phytophthora cactorum]